jgi:hypothetical protein
MEWRINSPPTGPWILAISRAGVAAKHVAPHHRGADVGERFLDDRGAFIDLAAFKAEK